MPRGGKGILLHTELYEGPDQPFKVGTTELPTLTCFHCNRVVILHPERTRERAWCWNCNSYICDLCKAVSTVVGCHPIEQTLELMRRFPNRGITIARGADGAILGDEVEIAAQVKPYPGISLPGKE